jgi:DNA-binding NarL/FixJ family response regulator
MPFAAAASGVAQTLPLDELAPALVRLVEVVTTPSRRAPVDVTPPTAGGGRRTTVLLADGQRIMVDGVRALLAGEPDIEVVGEAEDGRTAVRLAADLDPDVVVIDVAMPGLNGVDASRRIRAHKRERKIVVLSASSRRVVAADALAAGVSGYVCKSSAFAELVLAIRMAAAGRRFVSPRFADALGSPRSQVLTTNEREIVQLTVEGKSTEEIAAIVGKSPPTVDAGRRLVMEKLGIDTAIDLVRYALREGVVSLEG